MNQMKRRQSQKDKELADNARLLRAWRTFHREEKTAVLSGPYSATLIELFRMFSAIEHVKPAQLVGFIGAIDWSGIDHQTRLVVLHELNSAIVRHCTSHGLDPISDPLPDQPDNAFRIVKKLLAFPHQAERPARRGPYPGADHK